MSEYTQSTTICWVALMMSSAMCFFCASVAAEYELIFLSHANVAIGLGLNLVACFVVAASIRKRREGRTCR